MRSVKPIVWVLIAIFLNQLVWLAAIPYNFAPDEFGHWDVVETWVRNGKYPRFLQNPSDGVVRRDGMTSVSYSALQPLPYLWAGIPVWLVKNQIQDKHGYLFARLGSAMATVVFAAGIYWGLNLLKAEEKWRWMGVVIAGFIPQVSFIGGYVTSDAVALAAAAWLTAGGLHLLTTHTKISWSLAIWWGTLVGLTLLTRYNSYPLIAVFGLAVAVKWLKQKQISALLVSALTGGVVAGWWIVGGLKTLQSFYQILYQIRAGEFHHFGIWQMLVSTSWIETTAKSAFAAFDWNYLFLPNWMYLVVLVAMVTGLTAYIKRSTPILNWTLIPAVVLTIGQALIQSSSGSFQPQGRHLFAVLPILFLTLWLGWNKFNSRRLIAGISLGVIGTNLYSLLGIILPRYYGQGMQLTGLSLYRQALWEIVFSRPWPWNWPTFAVIVLLWVGCMGIILGKLVKEMAI